MHVATVIPIARGIPFDILSYYSPHVLEPGTLVAVPFGKREIHAIVIDSVPLTEAKTMIKQAAFSLKKIARIIVHLHFFENTIKALALTAVQTMAPVGAIAGSAIPQILFEYIRAEKLPDQLIKQSESVFSESVSIGTTSTRSDEYKRLIRSTFAAKKSVYVVAPTIRSLELWKSRLEKGIQKHVVILHSKTTKKDVRSYFALIKSTERPLLVFVTPGYFLIPRSDIGCVIVESESSSLYKTADRYGIDMRLLIKHFSEFSRVQLVWGDTLPRLETLERLNLAHVPRSYVPDKLHIVAIESYRTTLPSEVIDLIRHAQKKKYRLFIYTHRKGIAPLSRCADCATVVNCATCTLPVVLRNRILSNGSKERYFICLHCGDTLPLDYTCVHCGSWNITPLSIGSESIYQEVTSLVGEEHVAIINDDITPDSTSIETIIRTTQQKKFFVLIGTTKVLPYLKNIHYTLFPFFDRLLSTPSLYTTENALRLVMECNEQSSAGVIVCTRLPQFPMIRQLETQKINAILHDELSVRKELGYPPYGLLIKISLTIPEGHSQRVKQSIESFFTNSDITPLAPRRISPGSMKVLMVWVIKAPLTYIEDEGDDVVTFLKSLRFPYKIEQNPERF